MLFDATWEWVGVRRMKIDRAHAPTLGGKVSSPTVAESDATFVAVSDLLLGAQYLRTNRGKARNREHGRLDEDF